MKFPGRKDKQTAATLLPGTDPDVAVINAIHAIQQEKQAIRDTLESTARELIKGLKTLESLSVPNTEGFHYKIKEEFNSLTIRTNVPVSLDSKLRIEVERDGKITAYGDTIIKGSARRSSYKTIEESINTKNAHAAPIIDFVTKKAARAGLIKLDI